MSKTRWIVFAVICVLVLGGLVFFVNRNRVDVSNIDPAKIITASEETPGDNVYGNKNAKVIVFEYGDFQCPGCEAAYPQLKTIKDAYKDQIAFVFRNMPLTSAHPNALSAAAAAEAAALQGKFWEMHDQLYDNQSSWSSASTDQRNTIFEQYAAAIGLNIDQFRKDITNEKVTSKIARDRGIANRLKVSSTPTIYLGDERMDNDTIQDLGQSDGSKLKEKIDAALKAAGVELPKTQ